MSGFSLKGLIFGWNDANADGTGNKLYVLPLSGSAKNSGRTRLGRIIMAADDKLDRLLTYTSARAYGLFLLGFGLLSLLLHFAKDYLGFYEQVPLAVLVLGALFSIVGVPFLLSDKPLAEAFADFPPTDYIFFEFFCIKRANGRSGRGIPAIVALIVGFMLAVIGAFVPMGWVAGGIGAVVYLLLTVSSPEFSFFSTFLALPYLPLLPHHEIILAVMVGVTALSFLRKVALGKRVLYLEQYDTFIAVFILVVLTSGIFLKGVESFASSLLMAVLVLGYPMAGGMITNRRVADRAISSIVISSVPVSCYSVYQLIRAAFTGFEGFDGVGAAFDSPDLLAVYLIVVLILSVYFVNARRSARKRALYTVISFLTLVALAATLEVWAFVACGLGFLAYVSTRLGSASGAVSAFLSLLPYALILVPDGWLMRLASVPFFSSLGISEMVTKAGVSLQILADHILLGIGIGADSFAEEYEKYASTGAVYENSGNLLLEIGCEAGIFALAAFLVIMLIRAVHRTVYRSYVKDSPVGKLSDFSAAMLVSLLAYGAFSYIFADMTAFYLFFTVFGIGSSALRISKQDFDDLAAYLSDGAAADSSSIDVVIRRK